VLDVNQGVLVILLPALREALDTTIGMAAMLVGAWTVVSAVLQPLFGALGDRGSMPWLVPLGVCAAGFGIALAALAPGYGLAMAGVILGGAGTAAFHPEAARRAAGLARRWRATGISYLSVGGSAGYALGVLVAVPLLAATGRSAIAWLAAPGLAYCLLTLGLFAPPATVRPSTSRLPEASRPVPVRAMVRLVAVVAVRSTISVGVAALGPLYLQTERGLPLAATAALTSAFLLAGALGTMTGGAIADRFGRRRQVLGSFAVLPPLGLAFLTLPGWIGYTALIVLGAAVLSSFAVTVVMAQELMPARIGTASGLVLGLGFGAGGLAVGVLGAVADRVGLLPTLALLFVVPIPALALTLGIPETGRFRTRSAS
jgi:FSR family fosmidomycin resistance protein-like MFS transporter